MPKSWPFEGAVRRVLELLVQGDYEKIEQMSAGIRLTAEEMATAVEEYGRELVVPPSGAPFDVVLHTLDGGWSVNVPLWTVEEGRSELTLQLTVWPEAGGVHRIEVDDLHVL